MPIPTEIETPSSVESHGSHSTGTIHRPIEFQSQQYYPQSSPMSSSNTPWSLGSTDGVYAQRAVAQQLYHQSGATIGPNGVATNNTAANANASGGVVNSNHPLLAALTAGQSLHQERLLNPNDTTAENLFIGVSQPLLNNYAYLHVNVTVFCRYS